MQDIKKVPEDVKELKPTLFVGVPRVFDRLTTGSSLFNMTSTMALVSFQGC
jgi:long-subunit acyl-CoA synthetase (AMP-forming)